MKQIPKKEAIYLLDVLQYVTNLHGLHFVLHTAWVAKHILAHLPFTVCVWPQRYKHREWSDTVHMQLHYEYFKSDSIRVTLMSKCKIMFLLHFVSLHSKVSELEILDSCCSVFFWNLECISSQYSKLLQLNFTICFHSKVNLLKVVIKAMAPIFLLWVNFSIRFY